MEKTFTFRQSSEETTVRLDKFLSENKDVGLSRARIQNLIMSGAITVNGERKKPRYQPKPGDRIKISFIPQRDLPEVSEKITFELLYEDNSILVINKPPGLVVHPSAGHDTGTLVHGLLYEGRRLSSLGAPGRPGIIHRIDKDTSGILVIAKSDKAHGFISNQFKRRELKKSYLTIVHGIVEKREEVINAPIRRHPIKRKEMSVSPIKGREAITEWEVISVFSMGFSFLRIHPHTGRTHQIRVHMAYMGHPVIGDLVYGYGKRWWNNKPLLIKKIFPFVKRQMLHAELLGFVHPDSLQYVEFKAPLPKDMDCLLKRLDDSQMA